MSVPILIDTSRPILVLPPPKSSHRTQALWCYRGHQNPVFIVLRRIRVDVGPLGSLASFTCQVRLVKTQAILQRFDRGCQLSKEYEPTAAGWRSISYHESSQPGPHSA